jgi:DNA-binding transcriptional LysR family regulator
VGLAHQFLPPVVSEFLAAHPLVQLDLVLVNRRVDVIAEGFDVALRVRESGDEDPHLISRRLREAQTILVASPGLLQQHRIDTPDDLANVPVLGALEPDRKVHLRLVDANGNKRDLVLEARLGVEDFTVRKAATLAGLGVTVLPTLDCEAELDDGTLIRLLPEWSMPGGWLQAAYPHRRGMMPAVKAWLEHLENTFKSCPKRFI